MRILRCTSAPNPDFYPRGLFLHQNFKRCPCTRARGPWTLPELGARGEFGAIARARPAADGGSLLFLQLFLYHSFFLRGRSSPEQPQDANRHSLGQQGKPPLRLSVRFIAQGGQDGKGLRNKKFLCPVEEERLQQENGGRESEGAWKEGRKEREGEK